ncbi:carbon-monoxide dehydrogenase medium subunit [Actinomycetospora sp. NBRC 106375]|uniref:FAD binding domain-containing protein n=1 Tax=Actinomycetospora sp. NBRC 106375 TaxID=3032207 RepID=UPI0024A47F0C|nr:FAD binding domain-containing protein [Actinomycetospora sp. NBRC 106375]GLZ49561.1 carbon-monoxide dehydrogenase medium subunit [Actinomycetospora sp. NBRC 106375]
MKPAAFTYHRAHDVADAVALLTDLAAAGEDPKVIAGGQSLMPMMNFRLARPTALVDLGPLRRVPSMTAISERDGTLTLGALVTHHAVETATLSPDWAVLSRTMRWVGHRPIRSRGTVAGSLVHGDATAEWCLLALLLDAVVVAEGPAGRREIPAGELFHGFYATAVDPDEVVVEVRFTRPSPHAALTEFARRHGDFAIVDAAVALDVEGSAVRGGRVVLGGVAPAPVRVPEAEAALAGEAGDDRWAAVADAAVAAIDPPDDGGTTAAYRRRLTRTLVTDACREAAGGIP